MSDPKLILQLCYTLWLFNIAMENGPFIDDFPIKTSIYKGFSMAMLNNQRVISQKKKSDQLWPGRPRPPSATPAICWSARPGDGVWFNWFAVIKLCIYTYDIILIIYIITYIYSINMAMYITSYTYMIIYVYDYDLVCLFKWTFKQ